MARVSKLELRARIRWSRENIPDDCRSDKIALHLSRLDFFRKMADKFRLRSRPLRRRYANVRESRTN